MAEVKLNPNTKIRYQDLKEEAMQFLMHCAELTFLEQSSPANPYGRTSVNEILGMATRVVAEVSLEIQAVADEQDPVE